MYISSQNALRAILSATLLSVLNAQTPEGFSPSVSQKLSVTYGNKAVESPGVTLERADTQKIPTIASGGEALSGTFLFVMLDLDVPVKSGDTITGRQTLLHCMAGNFTASSSGALTSKTLEEAPATYIGPAPPPENPAKPHRYTQLLFEQPDDFEVPASQAQAVQQRRGFDIEAFMTAAGLSAPIQANFYNVVNNSLVDAAANSSGGSSTKTKHRSGVAAATGTGTGGSARGSGSGAARATGSGGMRGPSGTGTPPASMFTGGAETKGAHFGAAVVAGAAFLIL